MPSILLRFSAALLILVFSGAALAENYTVTSLADSGAGTLRQAIEDANATPKQDSIKFDLSGAPPHVLLLSNPLPDITETIKIDGSGSVVIDGSAIVGPADGLRIVDSKRSSISGLTIRGFTNPLPCDGVGICAAGAGIRIQGSSSRNELRHNRLLGNVHGIFVAAGASKNSVENNFIDGEIGALEPVGGDPLADEAFRTGLRLVNGFQSYGIVIGPGAPDNVVEENHTQRTFRGYLVFLSDQNRLSENSALAHGNQCYLVLGSDNVLSDNSCELTRREAFEIFGDVPPLGWPVSSRNRIADNYASRSGYGDPGIGQLFIQGGTDNVIEDNTLINNFSNGIVLVSPLFGNVTAGNITRSNKIDGVDRAAIVVIGFSGRAVDDNIFAENSMRDYSRASAEGAIFVQGNATYNYFFENYIGVPGGPSPSAVQVQGAFGASATNNRFEENIHERTDVLWLFDSGTSDNTICEPKLVNTELDVGSQFITPPGLGNEVFEECGGDDDD